MPSVRTVFKNQGGGKSLGASGNLCRGLDHRLAILVHQGEDPKLPYQALMVRQSAKLYTGFSPWGRKALRPLARGWLAGILVP
jgi:hypothetical protein